MSTKIYTAFKVKRKVSNNTITFWKFIRKIRKRGVKEVQSVLRKLYLDYASEIESSDLEVIKAKESYSYNDEKAKLLVAHKRIIQEYKNQQLSQYRNEFDFDVRISIRELDGNLYMIPHCDITMLKALDFLKKEKSIQSYCYWNSTDKPKNISQKEWDTRSTVWNKLYSNGWDNCMEINICNNNSLPYIDPIFDIMKKIK